MEQMSRKKGLSLGPGLPRQSNFVGCAWNLELAAEAQSSGNLVLRLCPVLAIPQIFHFLIFSPKLEVSYPFSTLSPKNFFRWALKKAPCSTSNDVAPFYPIHKILIR